MHDFLLRNRRHRVGDDGGPLEQFVGTNKDFDTYLEQLQAGAWGDHLTLLAPPPHRHTALGSEAEDELGKRAGEAARR